MSSLEEDFNKVMAHWDWAVTQLECAAVVGEIPIEHMKSARHVLNLAEINEKAGIRRAMEKEQPSE